MFKLILSVLMVRRRSNLCIVANFTVPNSLVPFYSGLLRFRKVFCVERRRRRDVDCRARPILAMILTSLY